MPRAPVLFVAGSVISFFIVFLTVCRPHVARDADTRAIFAIASGMMAVDASIGYWRRVARGFLHRAKAAIRVDGDGPAPPRRASVGLDQSFRVFGFIPSLASCVLALADDEGAFEASRAIFCANFPAQAFLLIRWLQSPG